MTEGVLADRDAARGIAATALVSVKVIATNRATECSACYRSGMAMLERHCSAGVPLDGILGNPLESRGILCVLRR
jgi:hypothetical protein